jgi:hypothetical protein
VKVFKIKPVTALESRDFNNYNAQSIEQAVHAPNALAIHSQLKSAAAFRLADL